MGPIKKKRKSFMQMAKKYERKKFGQGKNLEREEYVYYIRIFEELKSVDGEAKDLLICSLFEEISKEGRLKVLATNQVVSRILDEILPISPIEKLLLVMGAFSEDLRLYAVDAYASHVLQDLLLIGFKHLQKTATLNDEELHVKFSLTEAQKDEIQNFLIKTSKFVYNNLEEFINETYASHVVRTVLEICSGVEIKSSSKSSQKSHNLRNMRDNYSQAFEVPNELNEILHLFIIRFSQLPNMSNLVVAECSSAVLQSGLIVSSALKDCEKELSTFISHIDKEGFRQLDPTSEERPESVHLLFAHNAAVRLLEVVVSYASPKRQKKIYRSYFKDKISLISQHRLGNFALQKLITYWKDRETFELIYDGVHNFLGEAYEYNSTGVIYALVQACRKLQTHQSQIIQQVMLTLECWEVESDQEKIAPLLLFFMKLKDFKENNPFEEELPFSLHGSLILQEFLKFNKPVKIVKSILGMSSVRLHQMACDTKGSHVIDAFVNSEYVGAKSREKLLLAFGGSFASLACSKHGSRSLEALWDKASVQHRTHICKELSQNEKKILDNNYGKIIYNKFQVGLFKRNDKSDWKELQNKEQKRMKKLEQFFITDSNESPETNSIKSKKSDKRKTQEIDESFDGTSSKKKKKSFAQKDC